MCARRRPYVDISGQLVDWTCVSSILECQIFHAPSRSYSCLACGVPTLFIYFYIFAWQITGAFSVKKARQTGTISAHRCRGLVTCSYQYPRNRPTHRLPQTSLRRGLCVRARNPGSESALSTKTHADRRRTTYRRQTRYVIDTDLQITRMPVQSVCSGKKHVGYIDDNELTAEA